MASFVIAIKSQNGWSHCNISCTYLLVAAELLLVPINPTK